MIIERFKDIIQMEMQNLCSASYFILGGIIEWRKGIASELWKFIAELSSLYNFEASDKNSTIKHDSGHNV